MKDLDFSKEYWEKNYAEPQEMDGIGNAQEHARYAKAFFDVEFVDISSIVDLGFGLGYLLKAFIEEFKPYKTEAIEPSRHAFSQTSKEDLQYSLTSKVSLKNIGILEWVRLSKPNSKRFDLGVCTSVFQYLSDEQIKEVLPVLSQRLKYLYFSVPTDLELKRQREDLSFHDTYAIQRSKEKYYELLSAHFTFIGCRILESKFHFSEQDSNFTDFLFRF